MRYVTRRNMLNIMAGSGLVTLGSTGALAQQRKGDSTADERKAKQFQMDEGTLRVVEVPIFIRGGIADWRDGAIYSNGTITSGIGRCYEGGVTLQYGAEAEIVVDFTINAITGEKFDTWKSQARQYMHQEHYTHLSETYSGRARAGGFFGGAFGAVYARGNYSHYRNTSDVFRSDGSQEQEGFAKTTYNLDNGILKITGTLRAKGVSYVPITVTAFIKVTVIRFSDSKQLVAVDTADPVAAQPNGDLHGVETEPTEWRVVEL